MAVFVLESIKICSIEMVSILVVSSVIGTWMIIIGFDVQLIIIQNGSYLV